jgi:uncharacterized protein (DUF1330 family)
MPETPVLVVVEIISVQDPEGLKEYARRAAALIGTYGGTVIGHGATPVDGEPGFAPLVIQRWTSEAALRAWLASEDYRPLNAIRLASAEMRVAIVPIPAGPDAA